MKALALTQRLTAAVAILLIALVVIVGAMLLTLTMIEAKRSEIDARQTELAALQRRMALPAPAANTPENPIDPFVEGGAFALAANALQQRVVGLIESSGGTLVTVSIDPPVVADDESGRRVVVQAVAELNNDGLQHVLYQLESELPFVFVENLAVGRVASRELGETEKTQKLPRLSVDLRIAGYFRKAAR